MTTYSPVGPFTLETDEHTDRLAPAEIDEQPDSLALLDARLLAKTIAPRLALPGHHLALGSGAQTRLLRLDRDVIHLGRGPAAEIRFDDHRVSGDHAIVVRHGPQVRLLDNRSSNGTFVNGRRIVAGPISDGDVIELGPVRMQLIEVK